MYEFINYFAAPFMTNAPTTVTVQAMFFLVGILVDVIPCMLIFSAMLSFRKYSAELGVVWMITMIIGLFIGLKISTYPMEFDKQFTECQLVDVTVMYNGADVASSGLECHSRATLDSAWGDWTFVGKASPKVSN